MDIKATIGQLTTERDKLDQAIQALQALEDSSGPARRATAPLATRARGYGLYPLHQAQFSKRRLLEAIGGFDARQRFAADINLYYDMERRFRPSTRLLGADIAVMQPGGAANSGLKAMLSGSLEIYRHLLPQLGGAKAALIVLIKTLQSLSEIRFGRCPHERWFSLGYTGQR